MKTIIAAFTFLSFAVSTIPSAYARTQSGGSIHALPNHVRLHKGSTNVVKYKEGGNPGPIRKSLGRKK